MKKFLLFGLIFTLVILNNYSNSLSQSIKMVDINASGYPTIYTEFYSYDAAGKNINTGYNASDILLFDNGVQKPVSIYCPPADQSKFSIVLVVDRSGSMNQSISGGGTSKILIARKALKNFVNSLPDGRFECALMSFAKDVLLVEDFTDNKDSLLAHINNNGSHYWDVNGQTDYNAAMLYDYPDKHPGAITVCEHAKYKPFVIFLTDGNHDMNSPPERVSVWTKMICDSVSTYGVTIYPIALALAASSDLTSLSSCSGGVTYTNITDANIDDIYTGILTKIQGTYSPTPCQMQWEASCDGGNVQMSIPSINASTTFTYTVPSNLKPYLEITPRDNMWLNIEPGKKVTKDFVVTARNNYVKITGSTSSDPRMSIVNWGGNTPTFTLRKDASTTITVQYSANDSSYIPGLIYLTGTACDSNWLAPISAWIDLSDVNLGTSTLNNTTEVNMQKVLCNRTGKTIHIESASLANYNVTDFQMITSLSNIDIPNDSCIAIDFKFSPSDTGYRHTDLNVVIKDYGTYTSNVYGYGGGKALIEAQQSYTFTALDCQNSYRDISIDINNIGALDLNISNVKIDNQPTFSLQPDPGTMIVGAGSKKSITVRFQSTTSGYQKAILTITSDAGNAPSYSIELWGIYNKVDYTLSTTAIDFGVVCPDSIVKKTITIQNSGDLAISIDGTVDSPFTLDNSSYSINYQRSQDVVVSFKSSTKGTYTKTLTFTDKYCNIVKTVTLTGVIDPIDLQAVAISLVASVGSSTNGTMTIYNKSKRDVYINAVSGNGQFTVVNPTLPVKITSGGSQDLTIRYAPTVDSEVTTNLTVTSDTCTAQFNFQMTGKPFASSADLFIDNYNVLIGDQLTIPVLLKNTVKLDQSATTSISSTITYDQTLLEPVAPTVASSPGIIEIKNQAINNTLGDQTYYTLYFKALNSTNDCTDLTIQNSKPDNGYLALSKITNGKVCLIRAKATLEVQHFSGKSGDVISIPILLTSSTNISSFHKNIQTTLVFNGYILEPLNATSSLDKTTGLRTMTITDLPLVPSSGNVLRTYKFLAMLGTVKETDIQIINSVVTQGYVDFTTVNGQFALSDICNEGGTPRLFDAGSGTSLMLMQAAPNPATYTTEIKYSLAELGQTKLFITNMLGNNVIELVNQVMSPGDYKYTLNCNDFSNGIYFIILQTPTQSTSSILNIVK